jgi:ribonuclease D
VSERAAEPESVSEQPESPGSLADGITPLLTPRDGLPPVVESAEALDQITDAFAAGTGPVAVDAERASGYRYSGRAYLVQLRRAGSGSALVDPIACPDLTKLDEVLAPTEWVLHAATQDLPCLTELGLRPRTLFDTELAGRLLSLPKVGLGAMVEDVLGFRLEKGHAAADWSTRPLPEPWLIYAALDVELLVELRDVLHQRLVEASKLEWALEEFAALIDQPARPPRPDPWRRTSGIHRVRSRRELAFVRELWNARDKLARRRDIAPGRVLPDQAIVAAALDRPPTRRRLEALPQFATRGSQRNLSVWWGAVQRAAGLADTELPEPSVPYDGPPPARSWADKDPQAAARLTVCRNTLNTIAEDHLLPVENLLAPDTLRRVIWELPEPLTSEHIAEELRSRGAREWQITLVAGPLTDALSELEQ